MPVGHIWKFDLDEYEIRGFGMKFNFSKIRIEPVMLSFVATTENKNKKSEQPNYNCGKVVKQRQWETAIRNFRRRKRE